MRGAAPAQLIKINSCPARCHQTGSMTVKITPEIAFKGLESIDRIRDRVDKELTHLEALFPNLTSCSVMIQGPGGRRRSGDLANVRLRLGLPGGRHVAVSAQGDDKHAHEDVCVAVRDAFRAAERQLKKLKPNPRIVGAAGETRLAGGVARFIAEEPAGFIKGEDGRDYYFHAREVTDAVFDDLVIGDPVTFRVEAGEKGPMARAVHRRQQTKAKGGEHV